jgi:PAS domain S-box-containing protein
MLPAAPHSAPSVWGDGERVFSRARHPGHDGGDTILIVRPAIDRPPPGSFDLFAYEFSLKDELDSAWAVRPLELMHEDGRTLLLLEDPGGEPLEQLLGAPMDVKRFLGLAAGIAAALGKLHQRGLVHKDVKPANILVNCADGQPRLTGFGIASRLPRQRQAPDPPETIAGTLAYMAPEQTGRMNRSIDARSDLYALGITLYQMLTGTLPFTADDAMEWVHCHIARLPVPPDTRLASVPGAVSAIVMKLLAKTAEERYQTATGVEHDLRHCLAAWERHGRIDGFRLSQKDTPDRLLIPEKLYGREREIAALLAAFNRVGESGAPELVLVSGYSGIGKSSVVNELHKMLVPPRGLFAAGKFDQYQRDIPYATLARAFQDLMRSLLSKSDAELAPWREALREALFPNGQLMIDLIPALEPLIGPQPPVSELPPQDAQRRFQLVFRRLLGVFARPEHPLALFLDDLQWLDAATLDLLRDLTIQSDVRSLLLIGAFRDNEVGSTHPLARSLQEIRRAGGRVSEIVLSPLGPADVGRLVADALHATAETAAPLADLVYDKTGGNPFFAIQFLSALAEEKLLAFSPEAGRWVWDLKRIRAKGYTDNVVDLMVSKLVRLPRQAQEALQWLAALGNTADFAVLALVLGRSAQAIHAALWEAVRTGLVLRQDEAYAFPHDRVQEAAYSLIPEVARPARHLRIGRILSSSLPPERVAERIFDIVTQLNRGAALVDSPEERERIAELDLRAGERAKAAAAYAAALTYLAAGAALLADDRWERRYELTFALEYHRAECELLTADLAAAEERLTALAQRARNLVDAAAVACLRMALYTTLDRSDRAIEVCLEFQRHRGAHWSPHPTDDEVRQEYEQIWRQLGGRAVEELIDMPLKDDPDVCATLNVLAEAMSPALFTDKNLLSIVLCRMVNLSLRHGNSDASCFAYAWFGMILGPHFGDYQAGFRFGRLGYDLVEKRGLHRYQARVYTSFGHLMPWTRHLPTGRPLLRRAFDTANKIGDLTFAAYSCNNIVTNLLAAGDPLSEVQREAEHGLEFARKARFGLVVDIITAQFGLVRTLRGLTPKFGSFSDERFNESQFEHHLRSDPRLALPECWYWIRKLQARVYANDGAGALEAASRAQQLLWTSPSFFELAEYHFYDALARAAQYDAASTDERAHHLEALASHHNQLETWAENCPENFANRAALVGAEMARIEGRGQDAMDLYEQAICSARDNGFVHNEAIANELAARFYSARGFNKIARVYLRDARHCYVRWGAHGKVRQLDVLYPYLREDEPVPGLTRTIGAQVDQLDLATVIKVSQAVSAEIVQEKLLNTLMRTAIAQAGAERALLILSQGGDERIAATATTDGDTVVVQLCDEAVTATALPESVLHYVLHSRESVILDDASAENSFASDLYIRQHCVRSVLGLPLLTQAKLIGMLYLENNLAPRVFAPARLAVLKLLASQAATALENTRLYHDLAAREAKIRRLVDANIIGIVVWQADGAILEANDAFLGVVGYEREDLVSGHLRWTDLTPPEWREADERALAQIARTGRAQPFEKEYIRKDGRRVPVMIGATAFEAEGKEGVAFVLDLTERKKAEEEARESEQRYREVQTELAHANRVDTIGQLAASIAHEVTQPIGATVTSAEAGLRWLSVQPPDVEEAREMFSSIVNAGHRAADVIGRIRELIKKAPPRKEPVDINQAIRDVIALTHGEAWKYGASVQAQLADGLSLIQGDRVQLQQVLLNLLINAMEAMSGVSDGARELFIITGKADSDHVLVAVRDSGPGFTAEIAERVFAPFYTTKISGLGMGLSICRSIVEAHGGRLWATSNVPRGAIFQFTVPVHSDLPPQSGHVPHPNPTGRH